MLSDMLFAIPKPSKYSADNGTRGEGEGEERMYNPKTAVWALFFFFFLYRILKISFLPFFSKLSLSLPPFTPPLPPPLLPTLPLP